MSAAMDPTAVRSKRDDKALADIACLHCEMEAMVLSLFGALDASRDNAKEHERAYGLAMALSRSINEVGRQAGAI